MREKENANAVAELKPDYMGFIFYAKSPRYAGEMDESVVKDLPEEIKRVGVFVNDRVEKMMVTAEKYGLTTVQLHGDESPEVCRQMKQAGLEVIKAFRIADEADVEATVRYKDVCDMFLFDTKTNNYGGSGVAFDWSVLKKYNGEIPFLLSGGIGLETTEELKRFKHERLTGYDLNSRFEVRAGEKDVEKLGQFLLQVTKR